MADSIPLPPERDQSDDPQALLNRLVAVVERASPDIENNVEAAELTKGLRNLVGMTQTEFAAKLGTHVNTVGRWERESGPPLAKILTFDQLLLKIDPVFDSIADSEADRCIIEGKLIAVRSLGYLLERERESRTIWVLRSHSAFLSGNPGPTRNFMINQLEARDVHYRFLFSGFPKTDSSYRPNPLGPFGHSSMNPARDSHAHFLKALLAEQRRLERAGDSAKDKRSDLLERVKGWEVHDVQDLLTLGVGVLFASSVLMEYTDEFAARHGRNFDVFIEVPVAVYHARKPRELTEGDAKAWLQLAPPRALTVYSIWKPMLDDFEKGKKSEQYLLTAEAIDAARPACLPPN